MWTRERIAAMLSQGEAEEVFARASGEMARPAPMRTPARPPQDPRGGPAQLASPGRAFTGTTAAPSVPARVQPAMPAPPRVAGAVGAGGQAIVAHVGRAAPAVRAAPVRRGPSIGLIAAVLGLLAVAFFAVVGAIILAIGVYEWRVGGWDLSSVLPTHAGASSAGSSSGGSSGGSPQAENLTVDPADQRPQPIGPDPTKAEATSEVVPSSGSQVTAAVSPSKAGPSSAPAIGTVSSRGSASTTTAGSLKLVVHRAQAQVSCGDGQTWEFTGTTRAKFAGPTTCKLTIGDATGEIPISGVMSYNCVPSGGQILCNEGA